MNPPATRRLADFITSVNYATLPAEVVNATVFALIDWAGCAAAGCRTPVGEAAAKVARAEHAATDATLFADGSRTSAHWAAFANGAGSHSIELDDVHMPSIIHGGVAMIPAALAVAQKLRVDGRRLIEALVAGFDITYRLGEGIAKSHYERYHSTGTVGTFGAAAAAARLMGLNAEQTCWALGNAGSQAAGLWQYLKVGDDTKVLHPAKASMNGVLAASLAAHGFTGSVDIIEGERGFVATMADNVDWDAIVGDLGRRYKVTENGYKIHACCRHSHVSVDQTIRLSEEHALTADKIKRIRVKLNANSVKTLDDPNPPSAYKAKFSIQFLVASALIHRHMGLTAFTDARLKDATIRSLMRRVEVAEDPKFTRDFPQQWTAEVAIETTDGRNLVGRADMPEGDPSNPVSQRRLEDKCKGLLAQVMNDASAEQLVRRLAKLPEVADVREMFPEISASGALLRAAAA